MQQLARLACAGILEQCAKPSLRHSVGAMACAPLRQLHPFTAGSPTPRSSGHSPACRHRASFHSGPVSSCRRVPLTANVMRWLEPPLPKSHVAGALAVSSARAAHRATASNAAARERCSASFACNHRSAVGQCFVRAAHRTYASCRHATAFGGLPAASASGCSFSCLRSAFVVRAAHNPAVKRTLTGMPPPGLISVWPGVVLPVRAAYRKRYAPA